MTGSPATRVAAARRAAEAELYTLRTRAEGRRLVLLLRDIVDPHELISRAAEWRAEALASHDADKAQAQRRNHQRFAATTTAMLRDLAKVPDWVERAPAEVREATHAAGLLPGIDVAFERSAAAIRSAIVPRVASVGPASHLWGTWSPSRLVAASPGRNATWPLSNR